MGLFGVSWAFGVLMGHFEVWGFWFFMSFWVENTSLGWGSGGVGTEGNLGGRGEPRELEGVGTSP